MINIQGRPLQDTVGQRPGIRSVIIPQRSLLETSLKKEPELAQHGDAHSRVRGISERYCSQWYQKPLNSLEGATRISSLYPALFSDF